MDEQLKKQSLVGFVWRFLQNTSAQIISFIIQIVLARLLLPEDYGIISLTTVFITISNVLVQSGLTSGLIQKKEITELDKSSMFFLSAMIGVALYAILFLVSPSIADFYETPELSDILRIQSITILLSSFSSVSIALIQREMKFKKTFFISIIGYLFQGTIGIGLAIKGFGVWALVFGTLAYNLVYSIGNIIFCRWIPKLIFSFKSVKGLMVFSINVLLSNLFSALFTSIRSLMVGKAYSKETLGYYDKGNQFPTVVMNGFDGALSAVLYSSLSRIQDDKEQLVFYLRKAIKLSLFITVPMMFGLAAVAYPLIALLLTDKWLPCAPFLMIYCGICVTWPLSSKTHALNAIGKSKVTFIANLATIVINLAIMFVLIRFDIIVFAIGTLIGNFIGVVISAVAVKKYLSYSFFEQIIDVLPIFLSGAIMFGAVFACSMYLNINPLLELIILVFLGVILYGVFAVLFKLEGLQTVMSYINRFLKKGGDGNV